MAGHRSRFTSFVRVLLVVPLLSATLAIAVQTASTAPAGASAPPNRLDDNRSAAFSIALQAVIDLVVPFLCPPIACTVDIGGRVMPHPEIQTVFADDNWDAHNPNSPTSATINDFMTKIVGSSYLDRANQYDVTRGTFGGSHGPSSLCPSPPSGATDFSSLLGWITCEVQVPGTGVPFPDDNKIYAIYLPEGVTITGAIGADCSPGGAAAFHAWSAVIEPDPQILNPLHTKAEGFPFVVIPAQCALSGSPQATLDNMTELFSHELVEAALDPFPPTGWIDNSQDATIEQWTSVGEPADICQLGPNSEVPTPPVRGSAGFMVGTYWSNIDNACVGGPIVDLGVTKTGPSTPVIAGTSVVYDITVTNNGPDDMPDATVTDTLPAGTSFGGATVPCTPSGPGQIDCDVGPLAAGDSKTFQLQLAVHSDAVVNTGGFGSITDTVSAGTAGILDLDPSNNEASASTLVNESADLSVSKLCKPDTTVLAGQPINCTVFVDNHGPSDARNVVVDDVMLANGAFSITNINPALGGGTPGCTLTNVAGGRQLTCRLGNLAAASTTSTGRATITYTISANEAMDINNVATVRSDTPDPNPNNNRAEVNLTVTAVADLALTKTGPATATAGTNIQYDLSVVNNGPSTAQNVMITDTEPAGVQIVSVSSSVGSCNAGVPGDPLQPSRCSIGTLAPGAGATMTIVVHIKPDTLGTIHNDARASSGTFDTNLGDNLATVATDVSASADLVMFKVGTPNPVLAGNQLTYTMTVRNDGPSTAVAVRITDTLPAGTSFVSGVDGNGTTVCALVQPNTVVCDLGTMAPFTATTVYVTVFVAPSVPDGTVLHNVVVVSSPTPDPNDLNNTATFDTTVHTQAELWLDKTGVLVSGNPAPLVEYTLYVHNNAGCEADAQSSVTPNCGSGGPSDAQNIVVTDKLPLDYKKVAVQFLSPQCTWTKATNTVVCTAPNVPAGATAQFVIQVQVQGSVGTITNTATVVSSTFDPVLANNTNAVAVVVKGGTGKK